MDISKRTALVTGATGGLGAAIARGLAARGARLILSGRRVDVLEPLARELSARTLPADLGDRAQVERLAREAGDVDILVANAAQVASGPVDSFSPAEVERSIQVNLTAPILLARALSQGMVARGAGRIVLVSSLNGKAATPGTALYAAAKYGLRGFGSAMDQDLHGTGVGVSIVFPGFIRDAGMFHDAGVRLPSYVKTRTPADVARAVVLAIERERLEVDVAPLFLRAGALLGATLPAASAAFSRRLGGNELAERVADGQRPRRERD